MQPTGRSNKPAQQIHSEVPKKEKPILPSIQPGSTNENNHGLKKSQMKKTEVSSVLSEKTAQIAKPLVKKPLNWKQKVVNYTSQKVINYAKGSYNFEKVNESSRQKLLEATGNSELSNALMALAPFITEKVQIVIAKSLDKSGKFYKEGLKEAIDNQDQFLQDCLNATLLKMMGNIAVNAKIHQAKDSVSFADILSYLLGITENHLQYIHQQIGDLEKIPDPTIRHEKIKELLNPFKTEILYRLLPNQENDIVLPEGKMMNKVRKAIYGAIEESFSDVIVENYHYMMDPSLKFHAKEENALKKLPGGDVLNAFADVIVQKLTKKAPQFVENNVNTLAEMGASQIFSQDDPVQLNRLTGWLSNSLRQLFTSNDPQIQKLLSFSEYYLSPVVKHLFLNMAEKSKETDPKNAANAVVIHLLTVVTTFFSQHKKEIDQAFENLRYAPLAQKPQREAELLALFDSLSQEILSSTGLDRPNDFPLPNFLSHLICNAAKEQIPLRLVKLYKDMNPPERVVFEDAHQQQISKLASIVIENSIPVLIEQTLPALQNAVVETLKETNIDKQKAQDFFSQFAVNLFHDPSMGATTEYIVTQAEKVLKNILMKIASIQAPPSLNMEDQPVDLLPNLLVQIITLSKKHLGHLDRDLFLRVQYLKTLPPEQQDKEKEELIKAFIPLGDELLKLAGFSSSQSLPGPSELKPLLFDWLRDQAMPRLLLETYQGLTQGSFDHKEIVQNYLPEELEPLKNASRGLAQKIIPLVQNKMKENPASIVTAINSSLPVSKLPQDLKIWLTKEFNRIGMIQSPALKEGWNFIQTYTEEFLFNALGALSLQYEHDHPTQGRRVEDRDVLKQASLQMLALAKDGMASLDKKLIEKIKGIEAVTETERVEALKVLAPHFRPFVLQAFRSIGLNGPESLPVPNYLQNILWDSLTMTMLPELIISYVNDAVAFFPNTPKDTEGLMNLDRLESTLDTLAPNVIPMLQSHLEENKNDYVEKFSQWINGVLPGVIKPEALKTLLEEMINPSGPAAKKLLVEVPELLKSFFKPLIINVASAEDFKGDVVEGAISNLVKLINLNFKNQTDIFDLQLMGYDQLTEEGKLDRLDQVFGPFVDAALECMDINYLNISQEVLSQLHKQAYNFYRLFKSPMEVQGSARLQLHQLKRLDQRDINLVEGFLGFSTEKITDFIKNYIKEESANLTGSLNQELSQKKLSSADQKWLQTALSGLTTSDDASINELWGYVSEVLHSSLMQIFVDVAQQFQEEGKGLRKHQNHLIPLIFRKVNEILGENLQGMSDKIQKINQQAKNEKERQEALRKLFIPLAEDFFKFAGPKSLAALPIPDVFKNMLSEKLQKEILPDFLSEMFTDITKWEVEMQQNQDKLLRLFKNDNPSAAAKAISIFSTEIIPSVITNPENQVDQKILKAFSDYMTSQPGEKAKAICQFMEDNPKKMKQFVSDNIEQLFGSKFDFFKMAMPTLESKIEAIILKTMVNVFSTINEKQDPDLLINLTLKILDMANEHCEEIGKIMEEEKKPLAYKIAPKVMLEKFKGLHPAISRDPKASAEEKERLLNEHFLKPMTKLLLKLGGYFEAKDLPVPRQYQELLFELLQNEFGARIYSSILNAINPDQSLLAVLEMVNAGMGDKTALYPELETDETQKRLNQACGDLFLSAVKLIPNTAVRTVFLSDRMRKIPAASIGKVIRAQLLKTNLIEVFNEALKSSMQSLSEQIKVNERGEIVIPEDLHFKFPETRQEHARAQARDKIEKMKIKRKLLSELSKTLRAQIIFRMKDFFKSGWKEIQDTMDAWVLEKFGPNSLEIKLFIDQICRVIFFNFIGAGLGMAAYPFVKLMGLIINIHLRKKSEQASNSFHLEINRSLFYKIVEETIKTFVEAPVVNKKNEKPFLKVVQESVERGVQTQKELNALEQDIQVLEEILQDKNASP